jgi:uncharacterized protein YndB with AHSA1/START domain
MTTTAPIPPIIGAVTIAVPIDQAFSVFTASINEWWPHQYHIGASEVAEVVLEEGLGGRWYERGVDDSECDWGRVLAWEPPNRLVLTWQIDGSWRFDPDPEHASEIHVSFTADGDDGTTVELEHRHFDRLVGGRSVNDTIRGGGGWALILEGFGKVAEQRS